MSINLTYPAPNQEFSCGASISFNGMANSPITQIELWADDQWLLGKASVNRENWKLIYSFNRVGSHNIHVRGLDKKGNIVDEQQIWVYISTFTHARQNLTPDFILNDMGWTPETLMKKPVSNYTDLEFTSNSRTINSASKKRKTFERLSVN